MMDYDLVVIGSGPAGYKTAVGAARQGAKVALIERDQPGGTCLNQGCIAKKSLLRLASLIEDVHNLRGRGLEGDVHGDFPAAVDHKNSVVQAMREHFPAWLKRLGVTLYDGDARLTAPREVRVALAAGDMYLRAPRVVIATGSAPRVHPVCRTDGVRILSSRDFMLDQQTLPSSVLCVGAGAIGTELGYLLHQFGAKVTLVDPAPRLLARASMPERASNTLARKFQRLGVGLKLSTEVVGCDTTSTGVDVRFSDGTQARYDRLLVAIGRRPNTDGLGLEDIGVAISADGFIETSAYLETNVPGIYAVGDVKRGPMNANSALHDAKVAAVNLVQGNRMKANYHRVPEVIDSALEIATVGLTESMAEEAGFTPDVARANLVASAKARAYHDYEGFVEVVHDEETGQMLGGCIVGPEAGEQIHMLVAACQSARGLWFLTDLCYSHPSWSEELENAVDPYTWALLRSGKDLYRPGIYAGLD